MKLDLETIKKLAKSIEEHNLSEISLEVDGAKITLKKEELMKELAGVQKVIPSEVRYEEVEMSNPTESVVENTESIVEDAQEVLSPMVGTFYSAPSPESDNFVKVGDRVEVGDTLCIVEAMKMMNEVKSSVSGTIVSIKAEAGSVVKKGDILFLVK
nr:acetyl-CoA carboxylase biotin carboxyl carrier protein [uncultured Cetobacterium sp.]